METQYETRIKELEANKAKLEEEIKHGYIPVNKAESIIRGLNQGWSIKDFDELAD